MSSQARKLADLLDMSGDVKIAALDKSSNTHTSTTEPSLGVKVGDTWFDPEDEILSIASEVDGDIVWTGV